LTRAWKRTQSGYGRNARYYYLVCSPFDWFSSDKLGQNLLTVDRTAIAGSGESGKSTIVKQMKIIHQNGYTVEELSMYRVTVYKNLIECAKALVGAMDDLEIHPTSQKVRDHAQYLMDYTIDPDPNVPIDPRIGEAITHVWNDPCIPPILEHQNEFYLMDSAP
jgi:guanine nucleotide-binding protein subunit alpha